MGTGRGVEAHTELGSKGVRRHAAVVSGRGCGAGRRRRARKPCVQHLQLCVDDAIRWLQCGY